MQNLWDVQQQGTFRYYQETVYMLGLLTTAGRLRLLLRLTRVRQARQGARVRRRRSGGPGPNFDPERAAMSSGAV